MKRHIYVLAALLGLSYFGPAYAGPPCEKNPDHPSCSDGGGDGGGGTDPSANPALVYLNSARSRIELVDADGSNLTTVVDNTYRLCTYPKWSPDGSSFVFPQEGLLVKNVETGSISDLTPSLAAEGIVWAGSCSLDWSQGPVAGGGDLIAFAGAPENLAVDFPESTLYEDIYLLDPATGSLQNLTDNQSRAAGWTWSEGFMSWSPDGDRLAVIRNDYINNPNRYSLWILDIAEKATAGSPCIADTTGPVCIVGETEITPWPAASEILMLSWASAHDWILLTYQDDLYYLVVDGSNSVVMVEQVTGGPGQFNLGTEVFPTWAPGDDQIAFTVFSGSKADGLYRLRLADGVAEKLVGGNYKKLVLGGPRWADWRPSWTPSP